MVYFYRDKRLFVVKITIFLQILFYGKTKPRQAMPSGFVKRRVRVYSSGLCCGRLAVRLLSHHSYKATTALI